MTEHCSFAAARRPHDYDVGLVDFILAVAVVVEVVFHALVVIVRRDRQNFFCVLLHDYKFVKIFFNDVRFIFRQKLTELAVEIFFVRARIASFIFFDKVINIFDAALANAEAGIGVKHGHICAALNFYAPPA